MNNQNFSSFRDAYIKVYQLDEKEHVFPYGKVGDKLRSLDKKYQEEKTPEQKNEIDKRRRKINKEYNVPMEQIDTRRAPKELVDRLTASREGHMAQDGPNRPAYDAKKRLLQKAKERRMNREEYDLYDIILSYLLDEGYAETPEAAEVIMVNMSEDWREDILDEARQEEGESDATKRHIRRGRTGYGQGKRGESKRQEWHTYLRGRPGEEPLAASSRHENQPGRRIKGKGYVVYDKGDDLPITGTRRNPESPTDR